MEAHLTQQLQQVKWAEYRLGDLFEIENTLSFNKDVLTQGGEYDYVTRTSQNQGILQTTGFVNEENINPAGNWSLGLLQMDFFYRERPWYAGQFVRKITPKIEIKNRSAIVFFSTLLNKQKQNLLSVLVRNVDEVFLNTQISLPTQNGEIDFDFMENFISQLEAFRLSQLEAFRLSQLEAYLLVTGLKDYTLTTDEKQALADFQNGKIQWREFKVVDLFDVKNTRNILSRDITENSGETPYLSASRENNAVSSYISYDEDYLDKGNSIFIGGKTFVVTYQEKDFYSNDSHNLALYLKDDNQRNKHNQLFLASCVYKGLEYKYSWGDSISNRKIQSDVIEVPIKDTIPNYDYMALLISAIQKLVIKDVVLYADRKIEATKKVIQK
ncbi:restriction endonuclease subunit S [Capnocytophaga canimorsus]|uniref:restriction endonuclease subunit S n=1 Tax=Capnocytophaga canimorsus TaxID=28188 RepID=UPI0037D8CB8B